MTKAIEENALKDARAASEALRERGKSGKCRDLGVLLAGMWGSSNSKSTDRRAERRRRLRSRLGSDGTT
jgi:hypothetical protein